MTGFLVDTSVLSELAPGRAAPPAGAAAWFRQANDRLFVPAIALAEIAEGTARLRRAGAAGRVEALGDWLDRLMRHYAERILPFDADAARRAGDLSDAARARGRHPGFPDIAIAAIATTRDLTIATRNLRHFEALGVACLDPFLEFPNG